MPYEFSENEFDLEPQAAASRGGSPPLKLAGIGVLDPPGPIPAAPLSRLFRVVAAIVLVAFAVALITLIFAAR